MPTLTELLRPKSEAEWLEILLGYAQGDPDLAALPVTDFQPGGAVHTDLRLFARLMAEQDMARVRLGEGGFLRTAQEGWLDELAESHYNVTRKRSAFNELNLTLSCAAGLGPYEVQPGQLWASTAGNLRWSNQDAGVIPPGGSVLIRFRAESPGEEYNVPLGAINRLLTPLPGVSVTNAAGGLLVSGANAESDVDLARRSAARWAERGGGATRAAYEFWGITAHPAITKVRVLDQHPRGQGTVDVLLWGEGGIGSEVVALADAYIQDRRPTAIDVRVKSASELIVPVQITLFGTPANREAAVAQVEAAVAALQRDTPIGGKLYRAALIEAAMLPDGVENAVLTTPADDVQAAADQALTLAVNVQWGAG